MAGGISFISTFPIPTLSTPNATFNLVPYAYNSINYPQDFVWNGAYLNVLNPGQVITITLSAPMTQAFPAGTPFNQIATAITSGAEYTTGNNSALATGIVESAADLWITKTLVPFTGYATGDEIDYIITYGNSGSKPAIHAGITDFPSSDISLPSTTFSLNVLS